LKRGVTDISSSSSSSVGVGVGVGSIGNQNHGSSNSNKSSSRNGYRSEIMKVTDHRSNSEAYEGIDHNDNIVNVNHDVKHDDDNEKIDKSVHDDEISRITILYTNKLNIIENELKIANDDINKYKNEIQIYKSIINNNNNNTTTINSSSNNNNNNSSSSSSTIDNLHKKITENNLKFENEKKNLQELYENRIEDMRRSHTNYTDQMTSLWKQERDKLIEQLHHEENRCQDLRSELMKVITNASTSSNNDNINGSNQKVLSMELNHFQVLYCSNNQYKLSLCHYNIQHS